MKVRVGIVLFFCLIMLPVFAAGQDDVNGLITKGDSLAASWDYQGAAISYLQALKLDAENYEALWKAGDMYTELADQLDTRQKAQKETYFNKADELCKKAVALQPDGWQGHLKLSVVYGRLGLFKGGKEKVKLAQKVRAHAEKAIELNPQADRAMHVLARWHQNVAALSKVLKWFAKTLYGEELKGTNEEAVALFKRAIEINDSHIEHYLELAKTYKQMKKKELMREPLEKVISLKATQVNDEKFKDEARKLLKKLK